MTKADILRTIEAEYLAGEINYQAYRRDLARLDELPPSVRRDDEPELYQVSPRTHFRSLRR